MNRFISRTAIGACVLAGILVGVADSQPRDRADNRSARWQERGVEMREHRGRSVEDFLSADGQFDLEAIRRSGYQGALDLAAYGVQAGPANGPSRGWRQNAGRRRGSSR